LGRRDYEGTTLIAHKKRTRLSTFMVFIMMPLTIYLSFVLFGNAKYMITSLLIIIYTMIPFFIVFENRKPKAREVVMIAMMTAITCVAHIFFHVTVPIQIGTALVIISGISLGPEAGFMVGALFRFVANFYMGQGPWTPWQMFCYGLLGFLAGLAFNKVVIENRFEELKTDENGHLIETKHEVNFRAIAAPLLSIVAGIVVAYVTYIFVPEQSDSPLAISIAGVQIGWRMYVAGFLGLVLGIVLERKKLPVDSLTLTIFTFFVTVIIYGGIMNIASMMTASGIPGQEISFNTLRALYITGLPYDIAHGLTAAICMFVIGKPMIQKIERVKIKYGIYR